MTLTKTDIDAIKQADSFSITLGSSSAMRCIKRAAARRSGPFAAQAEDLAYVIRLDRASVSAHFSVLYPEGAFDALRAILRAGDELTIDARENGNQYCREAAHASTRDVPGFSGLYHDECIATVTRNGKTVVRQLVLTDSICPANSARAISGPIAYSLTA